jgi:hypothetical protein
MLLSQDIPTAALSATVARILLIIPGIIAIVVRQFFPAVISRNAIIQMVSDVFSTAQFGSHE